MAASTERFALWLAVGVCLIATFYVGVAPIVYNDFWLQAKVGEMVWLQHHIPSTLLFPYTEIASEPFNAHEWVASVFFYQALQFWGEAGLPIMLGLFSSLLFFSVVLFAWQRNPGHFEAALGCGLLAVWAENYRHWLRPELLAVLLMVWFWICVDIYLRTHKRWALAGALGLTVVWTNCHGSFVLAPILVALYAAGALLQPWGSVARKAWWLQLPHQPSLQLLLWVVLATLFNPFSVHMHTFVWQFSTQDYVREHVPEWASTLDARHTESRGFAIGMVVWLAAVGRLALDAWRRQWHLTESLILLAFSVLAFYSIRFLVYLGLVAAMVYSVPRPAGRFVPSTVVRRALVAMLAGLSLLLAILYGNAYRASPLLPPANVKFTPGLVQLLANPALQGHVLNSLELGSELVYRAYPRLQPSLDSRIDSYGLDYILYQRALLEDDALLREYVARYDVRYVLLDTVRFGIFSQLPSWKLGTWRVLYRSAKEVFLIRSDLPNPLSVAPA